MVFQRIDREVLDANCTSEDFYLYGLGSLTKYLSIEVETMAMDLEAVHFAICLRLRTKAVLDTSW